MSKHSATRLKMSVQEEHSWLLSLCSPHNTVFKMGLCERLNVDKLRKAIQIVAAKQPRLAYCFTGTEPTFSTFDNSHVDVQLVDKGQWQPLAELEMARPFAEGRPLYRFYILDEEVTELLFVFHHAISDGMSGIMFCHQVLEQYGYKGECEFLSADTNGLCKHDPCCTNLHLTDLKKESSLQTAIHTFKFNKQQTQHIKAVCEQYAISFSNVIGAAAVMANREVLSQTDTINYFYPVDLREKQHHHAQHLHYNTSWLEFCLCDIKQHDTIAQAKVIHDHIKQAFNDNQAQAHIEHLQYDLQHKTAQQIIADTQRKLPTVVVTGMDDMYMFNNMPLQNFYMMVNCQAYLANEQSFMLAYNDLNGEIFCTFIYVKEQISAEIAENICDLITLQLSCECLRL